MSSFPRFLSGEARRVAHLELAELIQSIWGASEARRDAERQVIAILERDLSLATEHLGSEFGPQAYRRDARGEQRPTGTAGTWAMMAAAKGMLDVVGKVLAAGVHPDDEAVFVSGGLLGTPRWAWDVDCLALALRHGADPDVRIQADSRSSLPGTPGQVQASLLHGASRSDRARVAGALRRLHLLLAAGAREVSLPRDRNDSVVQVPTTASLVASAVQEDHGEAVDLACAIVPILKAIGADLDEACGKSLLPPAAEALMHKNYPLVRAFIAAGCRIEDRHLNNAGAQVGAQVRAWMVQHAMRTEIEQHRPMESGERPVSRRAARAAL